MSTDTIPPYRVGPFEGGADRAAGSRTDCQALDPRAFSDREVTSEQLVSLLEAARWATSSYNEQPWRFIVARKSDPEPMTNFWLAHELNQLWPEAPRS